MNEVINWGWNAAQNGFQLGQGAGLMQSFVGAFFGVSGFHKLFNREKHAQMVRAMVAHKLPQPERMAWFVSANEFFWGVLLALHVLIGVSAGALLVVILVAWKGEVAGRVAKGAPYAGWAALGKCAAIMCMAESFYAVALGAILLG